jgi:hypothetical protein
MPTIALRPTDLRFVTIIVVMFLVMGTSAAWPAGQKAIKAGAAKPAAAVKSAQPGDVPQKSAAPVQVKDWGPYLDVAYELSYWDKQEIKEWREKRDAEIGETLAAYIAAWNSRLASVSSSAPARGAPAQKEEQQPIYRERDYLRLAIAQTIEYLQSDNLESLTGAARQLETLKGKTSMPEIAFWTGYVKALQALEGNDPVQFVSRVYDIWNNAVLYIEQNEISRTASEKAGTAITHFYYRNIINLVVNRAIISRKMEDLNALGPLFQMLKERNLGEKDGEGKYFTTLVQRITDGFAAPDSDRYRLNFTVAVIESKRLQLAAAAKLDAEGMSVGAQSTFEQAILFNELALKWAASRRSSGVVMAVIDHLDSTSFAIQRLADNEKAPAYKFFATLPSQEASSTLLTAMAIFNDIALYADGGWKKAGYESRELYLNAVHRFWRAIMELSLWTGDYYLAKLTVATEPGSIHRFAGPMQVVLESYIDFLAAQESRGFPEVIPDAACFGAAEAAEKLAFAFQKVNMYSTDNTDYNLWFLHRLQASEFFPFAPREIIQTAEVLKRDGRYNLFYDYFLPLAGRLKQSPAVKRWVEEHPSDSAKEISAYVNSLEYLVAAVSGGSSAEEGKGAGVTTYDASFRKLREELQRKPDHPVHRLLRAFHREEMQKSTSYTLLLKDPNRLNQGM